MKLRIHLSNGLTYDIKFSNAGVMRLQVGEITTLPNRWWSFDGIDGNRVSFQTSHIMFLEEMTR